MCLGKIIIAIFVLLKNYGVMELASISNTLAEVIISNTLAEVCLRGLVILQNVVLNVRLNILSS